MQFGILVSQMISLQKKPTKKKRIEESIRLMQRGLLTPEYPVFYQSYKNLYQMGRSILPYLEEKLLNVDWNQSKYKEFTRFIIGFFLLIHDLDEQRAKNIRNELRISGCPDHIDVMLQEITNFTLTDYFLHNVKGIDIYIHREILKTIQVQVYIEKWLNRVPDSDLSSISRIYIVRKCDLINALGIYTPILSTIHIIWENPFKKGSLLFQLFLRKIEFTLYHEIGHHVYRDASDLIADQERDADKYALNIYKKQYPYTSSLYRFLLKMKILRKRNYFRWGLEAYRNQSEDQWKRKE